MEMRVFVSLLLVGLLSQNLVVPVMSTSLQDQKNYYGTPDPHTGSPPGGSYGTPTHGTPPSHSTGGHGTTPSHGSGGYGTTPPSHGGGGSYNPTPSDPPSGANCGTPPHIPTPNPSNPTPGGGGGYYHSPPTSSGGTPPIPVIVSPPTTPIIDPGTPSTPSTPIIPPFLPTPSPPFIGTCNYWRTHPGAIWGLLGWWGTLGNAFGIVPGGGASLSLPEALSNTRSDGVGALYREGTASLLNSMVNAKFPFSTEQVRDRFVAALGSNKEADSQAQVFKLANEGLLKPRS